MIKVPTLFRYTSDKVVPWNYTNHVVSQEPQAVQVSPGEKQGPSVNDIAGTDGLTRNGRCYASSPSGVKEREKSTEYGGVKTTVLKKKGKESMNELVTETKANEFLKFIKQ